MRPEEAEKRVEFRYGDIFRTIRLENSGYEVALVADGKSRVEIATLICAILNKGKKGVLLIGITKSCVVEGIRLNHKERDEFRQGLDNLLMSTIVPSPYLQIGEPIFNPVLYHPRANRVGHEDLEHFVVRLDIAVNQDKKEASP